MEEVGSATEEEKGGSGGTKRERAQVTRRVEEGFGAMEEGRGEGALELFSWIESCRDVGGL